MNTENSKTYDDCKTEVIAFIAATLNKDVDVVTPETLINDISDDSIQLFELLLKFEKHYAVETAYEDVITLNTVEDIIQYVIKVTSPTN